ncbi:hypothetical protein KM043_005040 [Ampulex compressa]|nr:hypothetical protein KM043_005040 [Ampulex compressa]
MRTRNEKYLGWTNILLARNPRFSLCAVSGLGEIVLLSIPNAPSIERYLLLPVQITEPYQTPTCRRSLANLECPDYIRILKDSSGGKKEDVHGHASKGGRTAKTRKGPEGIEREN